MGIRFFCPHCDRRLHVKDYLAGKKGICPHCDEKIVIPRESTITKQDASGAMDVEDSHLELPGEVDSKSLLARRPESDSAAESQSDSPTVNSKESSGGQMESAQPTVMPAEGMSDELDPISAGPHLIWYVRPPNGGQYGPAEGDVMRQWVEEGRVTADSLVWQEGWDEWRPAAEIFPQLSPSQPEVAAAVPSETTASPAPDLAQPRQVVDEAYEPVAVDESKMKMLEYRLNRSKGKGKEIALVAVLTLVCLVLIAVLGLVMTKQF